MLKEKTAPIISVIVPVYKSEKVLSRCIDSILNQSFRDFELLLIDDGSPDRSGAICDEYLNKDPRICVFHQENGGVSKARNRGLKEASGDYIVFIDSDDWVDCHFFSSISEYFDRYDMLFFGFQQVFDDGRPIGIQKPKDMNTSVNTLSEIVCSLFSIGLLGYMCSMAIKRKLIIDNSIFFKEGLSIHEDSFFCYECLYSAKNVASIDILPYRYVIYGGTSSLSSQTPAKYAFVAMERIQFMEQLLLHIHASDKQREYILNQMKYWAWRRCLDWACVQPDKICAIKSILEQLSLIRVFTVSTLNGKLLQILIRQRASHLILFSKLIMKKFGTN